MGLFIKCQLGAVVASARVWVRICSVHHTVLYSVLVTLFVRLNSLSQEYEALRSLLEEADASLTAANWKAQRRKGGQAHSSAVDSEDVQIASEPFVNAQGNDGGGEDDKDDETTQNLADAERLKKEVNAEKRRLYRQRQKRKKEEGRWVASRKNPNIYVSGLPKDCKEEELAELFKKAGVFKIDPETCEYELPYYPAPHSSMIFSVSLEAVSSWRMTPTTRRMYVRTSVYV